MFSCKKLFKLQIRPPSLIRLIAASRDGWIFPAELRSEKFDNNGDDDDDDNNNKYISRFISQNNDVPGHTKLSTVHKLHINPNFNNCIGALT